MSGLVQIRRDGRDGSEPRVDVGAAPPGARLTDRTEASPRVYLETFGCQMNEADSALIAGQLGNSGYERVADPSTADVILINTCAIREKAEDRVWGRASQLLQHRKRNPGLVIGITGCMAERLRARVSERAPHIALVAGPDSYRSIAALVARARAGERVLDTTLDRDEVYAGLDPVVEPGRVSAYVTIQRGCDKFCSFCVVPYTRGRERGVPPGEVLRAVDRLAAAGTREVVLLGQTVNSYRHESVDFADLLRAVARVDGIERIRFTSPHPVDFSERVLEVMATEPKLCPQVHLPVQAGANSVLERMGRGYTQASYLELIDKLRRAVPGIAISTDIMVGFCGETEADHAQTLALMRSVRFDSAFMFSYSDRGMTQASRKLVDDVSDAAKGRRLREVIDLQDGFTRAAHQQRVGHTVRVLVESLARRGDGWWGRTAHFQSALLPMGSARRGEFVDATVMSSSGRTLVCNAHPSGDP